MLIGIGLNVKVADLTPVPGTASTYLVMVFQRWFDANKDVNWDALVKLCDKYPDKLGQAKSKLLKYIGKKLNINIKSMFACVCAYVYISVTIISIH